MLVFNTDGIRDAGTAGMVCRACGCDDMHACRTEKGPCHWVEAGLCSACGCEWPRPGEDVIVFRSRLARDGAILRDSIEEAMQRARDEHFAAQRRAMEIDDGGL